ncbi:3-hydroxyisobutyrate dehydrogenase [Bacillus toyonensis]|uniref:3-hydroxyisobutyrate dehydrogenase n=1 Tax=Bacillus cereus group TaxID=86661 RepID=UPI000BEC47DE|nr:MULTISPECIES: 3-hydroxyisobutyrate dehydrogenase [Bacillus cereus group]MBJ7930179.1 3-hydroxyisobutyrate dehydrogenase [Bacillus cereus group sp. N31]PED92414.1 3-hydroxyisobutyrate dehydrogenase [Bacillus toyonensis]PEG16184.1 3-hydroxyisobutyrate dehydrogenase [Bacillus toyonensis]PEK12479.1 3-hydroxyisobutyrate dehydrogenase [Bacillus toyonensis]PEK41345.1 3-hydroxyisobutyrate dehydrogenase [Bacillus toyonensis]
MIKRLFYYLLVFVIGSVICGLLRIMNEKLGACIGSLFISVYMLKAYYDCMNSTFFRKRLIRNKKVKYATLQEWVTGKYKGFYELENKIFEGEAKTDCLDNLRVIRRQILKLGKEKAKLFRAHLKVVDKNESYIEFLIKFITTMIMGIFLWAVKSILFKEGASYGFEEVINLITYCLLIVICISSIISNNLEYCYKSRVLLEVIDTIDDEEYLM